MGRGPFGYLPSADEGAFDRLCASLDPEWVEAALEATGTATLRKRRLPAEQVIWLVLGMALYRHRPIAELVERLDLVLPGGRPKPIARSAVAQARARVGEEPLKWLFEKSADAWAHASARRHEWRGLALYGVDGTTARVPDSKENRKHFGGQVVGRGGGLSGYPMVRLVTLMALRSHLLAAAHFGPYGTDEREYALKIWPQVPDDSLCVMDRHFLNADILVPLARDGKNRHWLLRAKKNTAWRTVKRLGKGEELVEMEVSYHTRQKDDSLPMRFQARAIRYQRKGFQPQWLLTSLLDAEAFPSSEVVALYHERWELELGYDEVKTEMMERQEAIRSQKPGGVAQELWGVGLAYNLVRLEMERIAEEADVPPTRISFVMALRLIRDEWMWLAGASPGAIPKHLRRLREEVKRFVLPLRRSHRRYPRAVKIKMSSYPRKRPRPVRRARSRRPLRRVRS
ncbi:IS4 family transposase [Myxococcus sp. QH3KD-4-1]|nr:IS4 family transposase [Myxococcus qinghaiensis]